METHKPKLRLRKQVIIAIPISLFLTLFIFGLVALLNHNTHVVLKNLTTVKSGTISTEQPTIDLSFLKPYQEALQANKVDNTVKFYARRFRLDEEKVLSKAKELTNNFQDEEYLKTYTISAKPSTTINPNQEAGIIRYVKTIYVYPEQFGYTWEELHLTDERNTERRYNSNNQIIMTNGMTFEQYVAKISDVIGVDPSLSVAIIYNESGRMRSNLFTINNNVAGMKSLDGWAKYPTLEAGVISFVLNLKRLISNYDFDVNTDEGVLSLSAVYVNGNLSYPAYNWYQNVTIIREEVKSRGLLNY